MKPKSQILTDEDLLEALAELVADGLTQAADYLSRMFDVPVAISNVCIEICALRELSTLMHNPEVEAVGVFVMIQGDVPFQSLLVIPAEMASDLANSWLHRLPEATGELDELARSALSEAGNIVNAALLKHVSDTTHRNGMPTPPIVLADMVGALVDLLLTAGGQIDDPLWLVEAEFHPAGFDGDPKPLQFWMLPQLATLRAVAASYPAPAS